MKTISFTAIRQNLGHAIDEVNTDKTPLLITRQNKTPAVLMSLEEYQGYEETFYLLRNPNNARRLNEALARVNAGEYAEYGLIKE